MKTDEQRQARELRAQGCSVKEIERRLGVSRSSVSRWVRDVELGKEQRRALAERVTEGRLRTAEHKAAAARRVRTGYQDDGRRLARERGSSYAAGCMLYWAEGDKRRDAVGLTNSDPNLLSFFADFLRDHFGVSEEAFGVRCNLFADHVERQHEVEQFWLTTLGLPGECLRKSVVNRYSKYSAKKRTNKLPYGTCRLLVCSTRVVQTIYGSIQERERAEAQVNVAEYEHRTQTTGYPPFGS
jgi:transcriptional regulator with XRE-family HTH domain